MKCPSGSLLWLLLPFEIVSAATPLIPTAPNAMAVDSRGNIYLAGGDSSGTIPTTRGKFHFDFCSANTIEGTSSYPCFDGFVMKLDPTGTRVLYATYIGGSSNDEILSIAVDAAGNAYVIGTTYSTDFPVTPGAPQNYGNVFVAKLNIDGSVNYSTRLGGSGLQAPCGIQIDAAGNAYVAGLTQSADFPVTPGAFRHVPGLGFISKINQSGTAFAYSTYFDAAPTAIAVNAAGSVYITGYTQGQLATTPGALQSKFCGSKCSFVAELNPYGSGLIYSTFLGGNATTEASSIALDPSGGEWVAGVTTSTDFPSPFVQGGAFVVKINATGNGITGSVLFGSSAPSLLGLDDSGNVYVSSTGTTGNFSVTPNGLLSAPCPPTLGGQVLLKLDPASKVLYASFARQVIYAPGVLPSGKIQGTTEDPRAGYNVSTLDLAAAPPQMNFSCPVNSASWRVPDGLAPGEIVSIFGSNLGPESGATGQLDAHGQITSSLAGTQVLFNGVPAPLLYVQSGQINTIVPFEIDQFPTCLVTIQIRRNGESAPALDVRCAQSDPGVFTLSGQPGTQGAILNQDGTLNSPANPARLGSIVSLFATGVGALTPQGIDGQISPIPPPLITLTSPAFAAFAGQPYLDKVVWAGAAPALVAGVAQINVQIPATLPPPLSAVPVSIGTSTDGPFSPPVLVSVAP